VQILCPHPTPATRDARPIEQITRDLFVPELYRGSQWTLAIRTGLADLRWISVENRLHTIEVAKRSGNCKVMGGSPGQKKPGHFDVARLRTMPSEATPKPIPSVSFNEAPYRRTPSSTESSPYRDVDRLNVVRPNTFRCTLRRAVNGMDIRSPIQKQLDNFSRGAGDCAMKRRATRAIAAIEQCRFLIQELSNTLRIISVRRGEDWMILGRCGGNRPTATVAVLFQQFGNSVVASLPCHIDKTVAVIPVPFRIRSGIEQQLDNLGMPLAYSKMNRLRVPVALSAPLRILGE
jgi:hypothetical protein